MIRRLLVFTDLDGSLLDHHDYSYAAAQPVLDRLARLEVPVMPVTSKTRAEVEQVREVLGNRHPFIAENGAAVFIPEGYLPQQPAGTEVWDGYWVAATCPPRSRWLDCLATLATEFTGEFDNFAEAGPEGIAAMTGLTLEQARLANTREFSEPVRWLGSPERKAEFVAALREAGANPLQGGRFLAVAGDCDKGRALAWLRSTFAAAWGTMEIADLAAGDSGNDVAMLEAAQTALVIRSPVHDFPEVNRTGGVIYSTATGPAGWAEGVTRWLDQVAPDEHI